MKKNVVCRLKVLNTVKLSYWMNRLNTLKTSVIRDIANISNNNYVNDIFINVCVVLNTNMVATRKF